MYVMDVYLVPKVSVEWTVESIQDVLADSFMFSVVVAVARLFPRSHLAPNPFTAHIV